MSRRLRQVALLGAVALATLLLPAEWTPSVIAHDYGGNTNPDPPPEDDDDDCDEQPPEEKCEECDQATGGKPVNLFTGEEVYKQSDLIVEGGYPIRLARLYKSQSDYDSVVGYGWSISYNRRLYREPDSTIVLRQGCGSRRRYVWTGGAYQTPAHESAILTENPDGSYDLSYKNGYVDHFDAEGRLTRTTAPGGESLVFTYDATRMPIVGVSRFALTTDPAVVAYDYRITRIEERDAADAPTGKFVDLAYDAQTGRLTSVSDSEAVPRTVTYAYDAFGNLTLVTRPDGTQSTYGYATGFDHNLTSLAADGCGACQNFENTYDANDRVIRQVRGDREMLFAYDTGTLTTTVTVNVYDENSLLIDTGDWVYQFNAQGYATDVLDPMLTRTKLIRVNDSGTGPYDSNIARMEIWENTGTEMLRKSIDYTYDANGNLIQEVVHLLASGVDVTTNYTYTQDWVTSVSVQRSDRPTEVFQADYDLRYDSGKAVGYLAEKRVLTQAPLTYQTWSYEYDSLGRKTADVWPDGHRVISVYDAAGQVIESYHEASGGGVDPNGRFTFAYDSLGRLTLETDPNGDSVQIEYDAQGHITHRINPDGSEDFFTYQEDLLISDELGRVGATPGRIMDYAYDAFGRLTTATLTTLSGPVAVRNLVYDSEGRLIRETDAEGRSVDFAYDILGRLTSVTSATDSATFEYDYAGNLTREADAIGNATLFEYDELGQRIAIVAPDGGRMDFEFNALGDIVRMTGPGGMIKENDYDLLGRLVEVRDSFSNPTTFEYDGVDRLTRRVGAAGVTVDYGYDDIGRRTSVTNSSGGAATYEFDFAGQLTRILDPFGKPWTFAYDSSGRMTTRTLPNGAMSQMEYDSRGRMTRSVDPLSRETLYTYNAYNAMTMTQGPTGLQTLYGYDASGKLTQLTDNGGKIWTFSYDAGGRQTAVQGPNGLLTVEYDTAGNATRRVSPSGNDVVIAYDSMNRRTLETYQDATSVTWGYDLAGNITSVDGPNTDLDFSYDAERRLTTVTDNSWTVPKTFTTGYDAAGRRTSCTGPDGLLETVTYNNLGRIASYADASSSATFGYDIAGRITTVDFGTGPNITYGYDGVDRPATVEYRDATNTLVESFTYGYDNANRRTSLTRLSGDSVAYGYDTLSRLTSEVRTGGLAYTRSYGYDDNGNRTSAIFDGTNATYSYDAANLLTSSTVGPDTTTYEYDLDGQLTRKTDTGGDTLYGYSAWGRMTNIDAPGAVDDVSFEYDAVYRLYSSTDNAGTRRFLYDVRDLRGAAVAEYDGSEVLQRSYGFQAGILDTPLWLNSGGSAYTYVRDIQDSVGGLQDSSGALVNTYEYDAFGEPISSSETVPQALRYTSRPAFGDLTFMRSRFYASGVGRWVAPDEIGVAGGQNLYAYVANNPTNLIDPLGFVGVGTDHKGDCNTFKLSFDGIGGRIPRKSWMGGIIAAITGQRYRVGRGSETFELAFERCKSCCGKDTDKPGTKAVKYTLEGKGSLTIRTPPVPLFGLGVWLPGFKEPVGLSATMFGTVSGGGKISLNKCYNWPRSVSGTAFVKIDIGITVKLGLETGSWAKGESRVAIGVKGEGKLGCDFQAEANSSGIKVTGDCCARLSVDAYGKIFIWEGSWNLIDDDKAKICISTFTGQRFTIASYP